MHIISKSTNFYILTIKHLKKNSQYIHTYQRYSYKTMSYFEYTLSNHLLHQSHLLHSFLSFSSGEVLTILLKIYLVQCVYKEVYFIKIAQLTNRCKSNIKVMVNLVKVKISGTISSLLKDNMILHTTWNEAYEAQHMNVIKRIE